MVGKFANKNLLTNQPIKKIALSCVHNTSNAIIHKIIWVRFILCQLRSATWKISRYGHCTRCFPLMLLPVKTRELQVIYGNY